MASVNRLTHAFPVVHSHTHTHTPDIYTRTHTHSRTQDKLTDADALLVSTEEERAALSEILTATSEWLYDEGTCACVGPCVRMCVFIFREGILYARVRLCVCVCLHVCVCIGASVHVDGESR